MRNTRTNFKSRAKLAAVLTAASLLLTGCAVGGNAASEKKQKQIFAMDTVMLLEAYGENAAAGLEAARLTIETIEETVDPERETSEVYALNSGSTVNCSPCVTDMLGTAGKIWSRSGGALDLTIYPVVKAWGFINGEYRVPDKSEIDPLLEKVDFGAVSTSESGETALPEGMEITFGAIAKGCAAEYAVQAMREAGVTSAVMSLGGNVQTLGVKPDGSNWDVGIMDPKDTGDCLATISVGEAAVVTSGSYQRYFEAADGKIYHHIIDPATGFPADSGILSVTVVCDNGIEADALSTAMFVLGEEGALAYRSEYGGFEMVIATSDGRVIVTPGLKEGFREYSSWQFVYLEDGAQG